MANKIRAISAYRPKIKHGLSVDVKEASDLIAGRSSLNEGGVHDSLLEYRNVCIQSMRTGRSVKLMGLGLLSPSISLDGSIKVSFRADRELIGELNKKNAGFKGQIINRDMIGKTVDDLVARWNTEHPDDPVV